MGNMTLWWVCCVWAYWVWGFGHMPVQPASWEEVLCSTRLVGAAFSAAGTQVVVAPNLPLPQFSKPEPQPPLPHPRSGRSQYPTPRGQLLSAFPGEGGECSQQSVPSWMLLLEALH